MTKQIQLTLAIMACLASSANAQTGGLSGTFGLGSSGFGGLSAASNPSAGAGGTGTGAAGGASAMTSLGGGTFGTFDSAFGATVLGGVANSNALGAASLSRGMSSLGMGGMGMGGMGMGGRGMGGMGGMGNQSGQNQTKVRATVKIGFDYAFPSGPAQATQINARLQRIPLPEKFSDVAVEMRGRTALIRGQVPTPEDGKLIERLLSLEPGVDAIENALVFTQGTEVELVPAPAPNL